MNSQNLKLRSVIAISLLTQNMLIDAVGITRYPIDLYENELCGLDPLVYHGKCKKIEQCINLLVEKRDLEICSFGSSISGEDTLVCCSRDDFYKSRKHSKDGVLDYDTCVEKYKHLRVKETLNLKAFSINGVQVDPYEFSHIAAIGWIQWFDLSVYWNCAGNLITESFVMSAAHCMSVNGQKPNVVRLGDTDLTSSLDDQFVQQYGIYSIIKHPEYTSETNQHDIALIRLQGRVYPTMNVVPACLNNGIISTEYFEGAGFGENEDHIISNKLSKVFLKLVEMDKCQNSYEVRLSPDNQICALGYRDDLPTQDLCYGDSGSALQYMNIAGDEAFYKIPTLVAITSFGIGCAYGLPSVYVNISYYIDWMESVISP